MALNKMGNHSVFCKQMEHSVDNCPERRREARTCHNCRIAGHIQIHCNRDPPTNRHKKLRTGDDTPNSADFRPILTQTNLYQRAHQAALAKERTLIQAEGEKIAAEERATAEAFPASLAQDKHEAAAARNLEESNTGNSTPGPEDEGGKPGKEMREADENNDDTINVDKKSKKQINKDRLREEAKKNILPDGAKRNRTTTSLQKRGCL
ncbi:hypothetical protein CLU79DRAFT_801585 [Phycomyces nitens]|nr:hypothetical protein CLU79DRAFT_801585 [Phycomyces nitens]